MQSPGSQEGPGWMNKKFLLRSTCQKGNHSRQGDECTTGGQTKSSCPVSQHFHHLNCGPSRHGVPLDYCWSRCFHPCHCPCLPRSILNKATRMIILKVKRNPINPLLKLSPPTSPGCENQSRAQLYQAPHTLLGSLTLLSAHSGLWQKLNTLLLQVLCPLCSLSFNHHPSR